MEYLLIFIAAIFVNNIVLSQFLGICPFLGVSQKVNTSLGMSAAVAFVMALATLVILILAGAGSGKTSVLTKRIQYRIALGVPPESILSLTFTAKAALEMKERVCRLFPDALVRLCTFHSLALFLLKEKVGDSFGYERLGFKKIPVPVESDVGDFACDLVRFGLGAKAVSREELFSLDLSNRLEKELIPVRESIFSSGHVVLMI